MSVSLPIFLRQILRVGGTLPGPLPNGFCHLSQKLKSSFLDLRIPSAAPVVESSICYSSCYFNLLMFFVSSSFLCLSLVSSFVKPVKLHSCSAKSKFYLLCSHQKIFLIVVLDVVLSLSTYKILFLLLLLKTVANLSLFFCSVGLSYTYLS